MAFDSKTDARELLPTGTRGEALVKLVDLVAGSARFQTAAGVGESDARKHIHARHVDDPNQVARPFVVVGVGGLNYMRLADGSLHPSGVLRLRFTADATGGDDEAASMAEYLALADGILEDVVELADTDDRLCISSIEQTQDPVLTSAIDVAGRLAALPFWFCDWAITWDTIGG
jgi:hypothetical protein